MNLDDLRISAIIKEGKEGDIVIVGTPFDYSRKRTIHKEGEENAPCCLRRFFPKVGPLINPEFDIDIIWRYVGQKAQPPTIDPQYGHPFWRKGSCSPQNVAIAAHGDHQITVAGHLLLRIEDAKLIAK